ncbi:hypothetical protein F383_00229 [Gossypium arboreum]|uniref:Uncharacterized protein n=1 Tax=Gossypium arboreum TaxID=29729 RepID=A0A0B0PEF7_GOSAR|nr:hypothetical protein F383_00229 [Gossypium arboreum]
MGSSEGDSTFAPRTATDITRGGLPLFLLRTEVEDRAFAAHHNGREEERTRSVRRSTPNSESEVSDAWKAGGWCPRRWWWCA